MQNKSEFVEETELQHEPAKGVQGFGEVGRVYKIKKCPLLVKTKKMSADHNISSCRLHSVTQ